MSSAAPATAAGMMSTAPSGIRKQTNTATPKPSASGRRPASARRRSASRRPRRANGTPVSSSGEEPAADGGADDGHHDLAHDRDEPGENSGMPTSSDAASSRSESARLRRSERPPRLLDRVRHAAVPVLDPFGDLLVERVADQQRHRREREHADQPGGAQDGGGRDPPRQLAGALGPLVGEPGDRR